MPLFTKSKCDFDQNLTVFLADPHVGCGGQEWRWMKVHLAQCIGDILAMTPLPAQVIVFGDLAHDHGTREDYRHVRPFFDQLSAVGIEVALGLGNHDRRGAFFEVFPECLEKTRVEGRMVSVVETPHCDFVMLDSLKGADDTLNGPVEGALDAAQQEWLMHDLPRRSKPFFLCAHHPIQELVVKGEPITKLLFSSPKLAGYIHGHNHRWQKDWEKRDWEDPRILRVLRLPSTGYRGDIGYVVFRTTPKKAIASLVQMDFYQPKPLPHEMRPPLWDVIVRDNQGEKCTFLL